MKLVDVLGGYKISLNEEEASLTEKIKTTGKVYKKQLSERDREMARRLVTKGVLNRHKDNEGLYFTFNKLDDCWRI